MAARGIAQTVRGAIKRPLVDLAIFSAATSILLLIAPIYMLQVYDRVLPTGNFSTLISLSVMATCGLLVLGVIEIVRSYYAARIAARIDVLMGEPIFLATMAGPQASAGDISPLRDLLTIRSLITSRTLFFLFDLPFMPLFLLLLALIHPLICLLTVLGGAVMVVIAIMNQVGTSSLMRASSEAQNRSLTLAQGFGRSFGTIRALGMAGKSTQIWGFAFAEAGIAAGRITEINAIYGGVARTVRMAIQMATLGLGAYLVLIGQITAGMIFASTMIAGRALQPLDQITGSWRQIADGQLALRRLLGALPKTVASSEPMALPTPQGNLVVSDLVYQLPDAAPGTPPLIKNVSFRLSAGETLSVIGPNRAGKTTLARLLVGALRPQSGTVRIDAINLHDADSDLIGRSIGYLPQDSELFPGTLAQNISRFDVPINAEAVVLAAKAAGAHELILSQHKGYETYAGPGGARLSGGERQRVALARALYGSPSLLVLDEPNANLDAQGDFALERVIAQARSAGRTVIVITHRPALAGKCDKILVLTNGSVSGFGPAKSVLEQMAKQAGQPEPTSNPIKDRQAAIK